MNNSTDNKDPDNKIPSTPLWKTILYILSGVIGGCIVIYLIWYFFIREKTIEEKFRPNELSIAQEMIKARNDPYYRFDSI
jgi:uncharacterized protein YneF (UPF0154 family)